MTLTDLSQSLFRSLQREIDPRAICPGGDPNQYVAAAIDQAASRLAGDRELFRRPERRLFGDIRWCFPLTRQAYVWRCIADWVPMVDAEVAAQRRAGYDAAGNRLRCPVYTRKGTPCERTPLPHNGHCPSHQHLAADSTLQVA